jgi:hypothetical protein
MGLKSKRHEGVAYNLLLEPVSWIGRPCPIGTRQFVGRLSRAVGTVLENRPTELPPAIPGISKVARRSGRDARSTSKSLFEKAKEQPRLAGKANRSLTPELSDEAVYRPT